MRAVYAIRAGVRHAGGVSLEAILLAVIITLVLVLAGPIYTPASTLSGTGGVDAAGRGSGVITVPDGHFGSTTTATVNPGGGTWVYAQCTQNGYVVYQQYVQSDASNQAVLTLGPTPSWSSGGASCMAQEGYWFRGSKWRVLAETTFSALP